MTSRETPFLKQPETVAAIRALAEVRGELTLVAGAGTSVEVGFPTWNELVRKVLVQSAWPLSGLTSNSALCDKYALAVIATDGLMAAATLAQSLAKSKFGHYLASSLYEDVPDGATPGPTARALARLFKAFALSGEVVTTNYDLLLEAAFDEIGIAAAAAIGPRPTQPNQVLVRHLHGIVPEKGMPDRIVFTEGDYFAMQAGKRWQEKMMLERLTRSTCLFVGSSLTDGNLLRYFHRAKRGSVGHSAVFVRETSAVSPELRRAKLEGLKARWEALDVAPLVADYYGQVAQFLYEVESARSLGSAYVPYDKRLDDWETMMSTHLHSFSNETSFVRQQRELQKILTGARETLIQLMADARHFTASEEKISLNLWSRVPSRHALVEIGSSDFTWGATAALPYVEIAQPAPRVAVEAFCRGVKMAQDTDRDWPSRWSSVLAVPVYLQDHPRFGRLPVGVLTVASTVGLQHSILGKMLTVPDADVYLSSLGAGLLDPEGVPGAP